MRRARTEAYILKHIAIMDPSDYNTKYYQTTFARMSDREFDHYMQDIRDKRRTLVLYAPNLQVTLKMRDLLTAANAVGLTLFERIRMWDSVTRRWYLTPHPYLILKLPIRRLKQYLMDKLSVPDSDKSTNLLTGQVVKPDKGSAISLPEAQTMDSKGLHRAMTELLNIRGGNPQAYASFKAELEETGQASLNTVDWSGGVRSTKVSQVFLNSMHLANNLTGE
jgi:hypothetical protein